MQRIVIGIEVEIKEKTTLKIPEFAEILRIGMCNSKLCLWVLAEEGKKKVKKSLYFINSGDRVPDQVKYVDTLQLRGAGSASMVEVKHVFIEIKSHE